MSLLNLQELNPSTRIKRGVGNQMMFVSLNSNTTGVNCGTGTPKPSRAKALVPLSFFIFLFAYLFSITVLYFFIISSLFSYFILFVPIFIQSYVNTNLHVSTLYIYIYIYILVIHKERNSESLKIIHLLTWCTFNAPDFHYFIQTRICINF